MRVLDSRRWFLCVLVVALLPLTTRAQADTVAPYRRSEVFNPQPFRQRVPFVDPLAALPPPAEATLRRDTTSRRLQVTSQLSPSLRALHERFIAVHAAMTSVPGFRIQVFSGTSRDAASRQRADMFTLFPHREVVSFFDRPYFKVRVGAFYSRAEADQALREIRIMVPGAFVVPDRVPPPR